MRHRSLLLLMALSLTVNAWALPAKNDPVPKTLTLDFKEGDVRNILRAIGTQFKINIVIDQNVTGNVTAHLENAPVIEGLKLLLEFNGYSMEQKGEIYYVRKLDASRFMNINIEGDRLSLDVRTKDINEVLREISNRGKINLVADQSVKGEISGLLHQVPLESGLTSLLSANGYLLRKKAGVDEVTKAGGDPGRRKSMSLSVEKFQAADTSVKSPEFLVTMDVSDAYWAR